MWPTKKATDTFIHETLYRILTLPYIWPLYLVVLDIYPYVWLGSIDRMSLGHDIELNELIEAS